MEVIDIQMKREGKRLDSDKAQQLTKEVTDIEVEGALFSIHDDKAKGVDGLNAVFYKKIWPWVKKDICRAIKQFFLSCKMFLPINRTNITLIPKGQYASSVN